MNEHVFDDLPLLLTGDADRVTTLSVAAHLRGCNDCCDELIGAVVAHASLVSAARVAPELLASDPAETDTPATSARPLSPTPDLSAVFAQVRAEAAADVSPAHRRLRRSWLVAAAVVAALGIGGGLLIADVGSGGPAGRSVALAAFDQGSTTASARLIGDDQMVVDASALPRLGVGSYYEVWLTNGARTSMAPIGVLGSGSKTHFTVPPTEMSTYAAIEVSVQQTAGVGTYSGHSVLRGEYA